jgi:CheY-like chemotaxis protein
LQGSEFKPIAARSLDEAQRSLRDNKPVAILLDVLIESETSWDFLSQIRQNPETSSIPIIVATVVDNRTKAFSLGASDFANKPLDRGWLLDRLRKLTIGQPAKRLLVVDDDEVSRYSLITMLGTGGYSFVEAGNGRDGLALAKQIHPDGIVLDLVMPEMNGIEVLTALKADRRTAHFPVVVNSSKRLTNTEREFLEKNTAGMLAKGKSREEVLKAIRRAFGSGEVMAS